MRTRLSAQHIVPRDAALLSARLHNILCKHGRLSPGCVPCGNATERCFDVIFVKGISPSLYKPKSHFGFDYFCKATEYHETIKTTFINHIGTKMSEAAIVDLRNKPHSDPRRK